MKYKFTPFVLEAQGAWGDQAKQFFNSALSDYAEAAGADLGVLKHYWTARIAVALQVGVQTKVIARANALRTGTGSSIAMAVDESSFPSLVESSGSFRVTTKHGLCPRPAGAVVLPKAGRSLQGTVLLFSYPPHLLV